MWHKTRNYGISCRLQKEYGIYCRLPCFNHSRVTLYDMNERCERAPFDPSESNMEIFYSFSSASPSPPIRQLRRHLSWRPWVFSTEYWREMFNGSQQSPLLAPNSRFDLWKNVNRKNRNKSLFEFYFMFEHFAWMTNQWREERRRRRICEFAKQIQFTALTTDMHARLPR